VSTYRLIGEFPDTATEGHWRRLLAESTLPSHLVAPEFFLEPRTAGTQPFAILAEGAGRVTGVLTGLRRGNDLLSGMPHRPQILVAAGRDRDDAEQALVRGLLREGRGCRLIAVHTWEPLPTFAAAGLTTTPVGGIYLLDLSVPEEEIFMQFSATKRNCIRQAQRKGLTVQDVYDDEDLAAVKEAFDETRARHRLTPKSRADLERLLGLERNRRMFLAKVGGRAVAATIVRFERGGLAEYSENASLLSSRAYHPNEALLWHAVTWARAQGCRTFSLGGANTFKAGFGARLAPVYRMRRDQTFLRMIDRGEGAYGFAHRVVKSVFTRVSQIRSERRRPGRHGT